MTWGSNATWQPSKCRYCGAPDIDDRDEGHSTHELQCQYRHWWVRLSRWWRRQDEPLVDRRPYMEKCKRLRTDGPTPCFCCEGPCWGDQYERSMQNLDRKSC